MWTGLAALLAPAVAAAAAAAATAGSSSGPAPRLVFMTIHYSHFSLSSLTVRRGQTVTFLVRNTDPIDHEFIVGDAAVQNAHELGTDAEHDGSVPGQISVPAGALVSTTVTFTAPFVGSGGLQFACHLPGHYAYGMHGAIEIGG